MKQAAKLAIVAIILVVLFVVFNKNQQTVETPTPTPTPTPVPTPAPVPVPVPTPTPVPTGMVQLFTGANYTGASQIFGLGQTDIGSLVNVKNDSATSIKILNPAYCVRIHSDAGFSGYAAMVCNDIPDLTVYKWNGQISSLNVIPKTSGVVTTLTPGSTMVPAPLPVVALPPTPPPIAILPPTPPPVVTQPVTSSSYNPQWQTGESGAQSGGTADGNNMLVCNAVALGSKHPGKSWTGYGKCNIEHSGLEIPLPVAGYLTANSRYSWTKTPTSKVIGGKDANAGDLYVCRGRYNGGTHPGKTWTNNNSCYIGWGGKSVVTTDFDYLSYS